MLRKLFIFIGLTAATCAIAAAQQSTAPSGKTARIITSSPFESSYLGVQTQDINKENLGKYNLNEVRGVGVEKVVENSPAAKAGLQNGDVIVRFEGEDVTSVRKLNRLIGEVAPDHQVKIKVLRGGDEREITATIGKRDLPMFQNGGFNLGNLELGNLQTLPTMPTMPNLPRTQVMPLPALPNGQGNYVFRLGANRQIGVGVSPLNAQLGEYFGIGEGKGLLVNNVRENSPAAKAGLKAGDVIIEADGKEVKLMVDLIRALNDKKEGDVSLTIVRDKNRQTVRVTPETVKGDADGFEQYFETTPDQMNLKTPAKILITPSEIN